MSDIREAFERVQRKFISKNSIDVERATVLRSDWELAKQYMTTRAQAVPEWVIADDLLPDAGLEVLTYTPGVDGYYLDYVDVCADTGSKWFANDPHRSVKLWLQIPQPPQEGE